MVGRIVVGGLVEAAGLRIRAEFYREWTPLQAKDEGAGPSGVMGGATLFWRSTLYPNLLIFR